MGRLTHGWQGNSWSKARQALVGPGSSLRLEMGRAKMSGRYAMLFYVLRNLGLLEMRINKATKYNIMLY
jgi:hypothetical protein